MNYLLKNDQLNVEISTKGAEIRSIKYGNLEYLHDSNPVYWHRCAPILFPNVGAIKDKYTIINGVSYPLKKHGVLRDREYEAIYHSDLKLILKTTQNEETKVMYPFDFTFIITYELDGRKLRSTIEIINDSDITMPFNLGLHPAFKIPLTDKEKFEDYTIFFGEKNTYELPTFNLEDGSIDFTRRYRSFINFDTLHLDYKDFNIDALVFENIASKTVNIRNKDNTHGVFMNFPQFKHLGIWTPSKINSPFVCLEPWIGCADRPDTNHQFTEKRDIINLESKKNIKFDYFIEVY